LPGNFGDPGDHHSSTVSNFICHWLK
jgi:hypothetical protein